MSKIDLRRIADLDIWRALLARSPQGTRFLDPDFLALFDVSFRLYGLFRGNICIMGLPVIDAAPLPWCYRQGPIFYDEISKGGMAKLIQYEIDLAEQAVTELARVEPHFHFSLSPDLWDVRGYDWAHYHDADKPRCRLTPRYTAILSLESATTEDIRAGSRSARRQEERYASEREGLRPTADGRVDEMFALYTETFARQSATVPAQEAALFASYIQYFRDQDCGHILAVRDAAGVAVAMAFVFEDLDGVWHVPIIGTGDTRYGGTMLYFYIVDFALARGAKAVDFDGANSPNRGYFKHSLGALPALYFEVQYDAR